MLFTVREVDVLRLLCWCQNVKPEDLNKLSTETERENLIALGFAKLHERSGTLTITESGKAFLHVLLEGEVPNLAFSYRPELIERRVRLSRVVLTAYYAGINVFTTGASSLSARSSLFLTSVTRNSGRNSWGSARVGAIAHLGNTYYAVHYICPGIGRMAVNDELKAFHNHTNFGVGTNRAFLFAGPTYNDVIEELKIYGEKKDTKLIRYGDVYRGLTSPIHLLSCDETGARQLQIMCVPNYREKLAGLMLKGAYQPPPDDAPAWDGMFNGSPFVVGVDMNLRRIDAAVKFAKKKDCLPILLAALDGQGDAVLLSRYRGRSAITATIIGVDPLSVYVWNPKTEQREKKTMYCAIVVPYRVRIVIPASEMWEEGEERPDYVLQNMVGATVDLIIIKVEREGGFAIGSRRLANRSQRYFFAHREDLHRIGARVKCRMLAVGPRRCLVDCYGHDLDITQREMRYASIPDLRNEYHPGMEIDCIVKVFDPDNDKLEISIKETEVNPFFGAEQRHPVGSRRLAVISGKYGGGVFCNLPDGVVCMCNYSYQHEDADFMVGENVMLIVQRYEDEKLQMYGKIMSKW